MTKWRESGIRIPRLIDSNFGRYPLKLREIWIKPHRLQ
jgi:hypothetical protein